MDITQSQKESGFLKKLIKTPFFPNSWVELLCGIDMKDDNVMEGSLMSWGSM